MMIILNPIWIIVNTFHSADIRCCSFTLSLEMHLEGHQGGGGDSGDPGCLAHGQGPYPAQLFTDLPCQSIDGFIVQIFRDLCILHPL